MYRKVIILALVAIFASSNASALFIGTAPGNHELGTLERGETYEINYYVTTDGGQNFTVKPEPVRPGLDFYKPQDRAFEYSLDEASLENITGWISFPEERFTINPDTTRQVGLSGGGVANVQGTITYFLEVPRDAEPGYHAWQMDMEQDLTGDGSGGSLSTIALSKYTFVFRVPGNVERNLEISNVEGLRSGDNMANMRYEVSNEGSVTMRLNSLSREILDTNGNLVHKTGFKTHEYISPGESTTVEGIWRTGKEDLRAGNYRVRGQANYITGQAFMDDTFSIEDFIEIESSSNASGGGVLPSGDGGNEGGVPFWMVAMFLVIVGALMYALEIDPLLIIMALGVIGISAFILVSGLPVFLIGIVLIASLFLLYYGWF